jgi:hypothetical protein
MSGGVEAGFARGDRHEVGVTDQSRFSSTRLLSHRSTTEFASLCKSSSQSSGVPKATSAYSRLILSKKGGWRWSDSWTALFLAYSKDGKGHTGEPTAWFALNAVVEALDFNQTLWPSRAGCFRTASLLDGELGQTQERRTGRAGGTLDGHVAVGWLTSRQIHLTLPPARPGTQRR